MGNTIPSPALPSGGALAPPDARQYLQAEWKKCIIQVCVLVLVWMCDPVDSVDRFDLTLASCLDTDTDTPRRLRAGPFRFNTKQEQLGNSKFMKTYRCKVRIQSVCYLKYICTRVLLIRPNPHNPESDRTGSTHHQHQHPTPLKNTGRRRPRRRESLPTRPRRLLLLHRPRPHSRHARGAPRPHPPPAALAAPSSSAAAAAHTAI